MAILLAGCPKQPETKSTAASPPQAETVIGEPAPEEAERPEEVDPETRMRLAMVSDQIVARGITDQRVISAMREVPRHEFMPDAMRYLAYSDSPAPIGYDQTISQPYIVAIMTELLQLEEDDKVLEIGTGSGYQAAVLGEIGVEVYSIEIVCELADRAKATLAEQGYDNVHVKCGDGYKGWPEHAPFDAIIVTAAPPEVPQALVEQLAPGGRMVVPVGDYYQKLRVISKDPKGETHSEDIFDVRFVPMVRGAQIESPSR